MTRSLAATLVTVAAVAVVGAGALWMSTHRAPAPNSAAGGRPILYWYDPMKPDVRYPGPGKSVMNMELIPKYADRGRAAPGVPISPTTQRNLGIRIGEATLTNLSGEVRAVGRIAIDERRIVEVQTRSPGYIEDLKVRSEGQPVRAGQRVAEVYSPELLAASQEYLALRRLEGGVVTPSLVNAARARLRLLGLTENEIKAVGKDGRAARTYGVFAPISGVVTEIGARQGAKVDPGQSIVILANLARVWLLAEVPERLLGQVHVGDAAEATFDAYAGEVRRGRVEYVYPDLSAESRTGRVRVALDNRDGRLRTGMFATVTMRGPARTVLAIPSEALIATGKRTVVIVQTPTGFRPAEVTTGREVGALTEILSGLQPSEKVVLSGQFLIDSEASLSGVLGRLSVSGGDR